MIFCGLRTEPEACSNEQQEEIELQRSSIMLVTFITLMAHSSSCGETLETSQHFCLPRGASFSLAIASLKIVQTQSEDRSTDEVEGRLSTAVHVLGACTTG